MMSESEVKHMVVVLRGFLDELDVDDVESVRLHCFINGLEAVLDE